MNGKRAASVSMSLHFLKSLGDRVGEYVREWADLVSADEWVRPIEWVGERVGTAIVSPASRSLRARRSLRSLARSARITCMCVYSLRAAHFWHCSNPVRECIFNNCHLFFFDFRAFLKRPWKWFPEAGFSAFSATGARTSENYPQKLDFQHFQPKAPEQAKVSFRSWIFSNSGHRR